MASAIYAVAISQAAASDTWSTWSSIVSNAQIKLTNNYGPGSWWLVIGKQQWGRSAATKDTNVESDFPISFSTVYGAVEARQHSSNSWDYCSDITGLTTSSITTRSGGGTGTYVYWFVLGKQQWGYNSNNAAGATTGFPISFASACYGVVHCSGNTGRIEGNPYITSVTTTTIKWGQYGLGYWIAFGL